MNTKPLVWITGAGGLIGNYLVKTAPAAWRVRGLRRDELDLCNERAVEQQFRIDRPDLIIHCAAVSKSPACDADPARARQVNTDATVFLSGLAAEIPFVFLSTDLVFDGRKGNYIETDEPNPLSVYAETKARAERFVLQNPNHIVVRTSLNAGRSPTGDRAFNEEMRIAFKAGKTLTLFEDEFRCPIPADVTARAIWEIIDAPGGVYHLCGAERLSRFEIGDLIAGNQRALNPKLQRGTLRDYKGSPRSPDTSMNCGKIQKLLSFPLPKFADWVRAQPLRSL